MVSRSHDVCFGKAKLVSIDQLTTEETSKEASDNGHVEIDTEPK